MVSLWWHNQILYLMSLTEPFYLAKQNNSNLVTDLYFKPFFHGTQNRTRITISRHRRFVSCFLPFQFVQNTIEFFFLFFCFPLVPMQKCIEFFWNSTTFFWQRKFLFENWIHHYWTFLFLLGLCFVRIFAKRIFKYSWWNFFIATFGNHSRIHDSHANFCRERILCV